MLALYLHFAKVSLQERTFYSFCFPFLHPDYDLLGVLVFPVSIKG